MKSLFTRNVIGYYIFFVSLLALLTACTPTPELFPTPSPIGIAITTPSPINSLTETPLLLPTATISKLPGDSMLMDTPIPNKLTWADGISPLFFFDSNVWRDTITWSPTANEILFLDCEGGKTNIDIAASPDFQIEIFANQSACKDASWSPDGRFVAYVDLDNNIQVINRDSSESQCINKREALRNPTLQGWIDPQNLIYGSYTGGGHEDFITVDVNEDKEQRIASVPGFSEISQAGYIPVAYESDPQIYHLLIISEKLPISNTPIEMFIADGRYIQFPDFNSVPVTRTITVFNGWLPETNKILVAWKEFTFPERKIEKEHLLLWDVNTNTTTLVAPNGIRGLFSPDGRYLAYITRGQAHLNQDGIAVDYDSEYPIQIYDQPVEYTAYLQILRMEDKRVILSIPAQEMNFSPNGRYLAFTTSGALQLNDSQWPVDIIQDGVGNSFINILDLVTGELTYSIKDALSLPVWAPNSERFLYRDAQANIFMGNMLNAKLTIIAQNTGNVEIRQINWSYDGQYFTVRLTNKQDSYNYAALAKTP